MKKIGVLTSGGDCQGLNPALRGLAKALYTAFDDDVEIYGFADGYRGLIENDWKLMEKDDFSGILTRGGTILGTSRRPFKLMRVIDESGVDKVAEMKKNISECHILALCGGFSAGDEPDGSGKFIANVLNNKDIAEEIHKLLDRGGLILGICNGFQALVKSGLLPYGRLGMVTKDSPVLFRNDINRHISQMVTTRVASANSPWLSSFSVGDLHTIAVSHGEGKFVVNEELARKLFAAGQVAFQYVDPVTEEVTMESPYNPNGSCYAIEGIISPDGQILGKMGHTERYERNLFKNIEEELEQPLFDNAVRYFRGK